jgi:hypothetical protein
MHFSIKSSGACEKCTLRTPAKDMQYNKTPFANMRQLEPLRAENRVFPVLFFSFENFQNTWPFSLQRNVG